MIPLLVSLIRFHAFVSPEAFDGRSVALDAVGDRINANHVAGRSSQTGRVHSGKAAGTQIQPGVIRTTSKRELMMKGEKYGESHGNGQFESSVDLL
jgi:hypothetical protein